MRKQKVIMSDFHNPIIQDMQTSIERITEDRHRLTLELEAYKEISKRLADIVKAAGCYTYPTYIAYQELVKNEVY